MLARLSQGEWFASRTSSAALYAPVYSTSTSTTQDDLRKAFTKLCADDTPMVRRAAAKHFGVSPFDPNHQKLFGIDVAAPHSH